ncbi:MAG: UDP-N-acetylglucosamine pyrophosphorylase [Ruminococcaceae bacterium]|nr:UDP-N-acetylglucosamine pyrophosphorylase [Oscillospiraceae bacterium]
MLLGENLTSCLFDIDSLWFSSLFENVHQPWQVLERIQGYIAAFPKDGFEEYKEGVYVGRDVEIHPSAVIEAPCIIGAGSKIRTSAYIRGRVITGENCVIGNSSEVKNSVLMNRVQLPHYNYAGDSILGNFAHMGAGAICSNLKSDGSDVVIHSDIETKTGLRKLGAILGDRVEIGCNCVLNPGTVIGKNTSVYPLTSVRGVIPENSIVKSQGIVVNKL